MRRAPPTERVHPGGVGLEALPTRRLLSRLHQGDLAAPLLLRRTPDQESRPRHAIQNGPHGQGRPQRGRPDQVVAAGVSHPGQGVVLGADHHRQRARPGVRLQGGGQLVDRGHVLAEECRIHVLRIEPVAHAAHGVEVFRLLRALFELGPQL
jgi:hypothetical protein